MKDICMLVQSCDKYERYWEGWYLHYEKNFPYKDLPVYLITETKQFPYPGVMTINTGSVTDFADMLIHALQSLPYKSILYTLDDLWMVKEAPDIPHYYREFLRHGMDALRLLPEVYENTDPYKFVREGEYLRIQRDSMYQISLDTSLWNRDFFLRCLILGENPWQIEVDGSERIGKTLDHRIYFVEGMPRWFHNTVLKGRLHVIGEVALQNIRQWKMSSYLPHSGDGQR